MTPRAEKRVLNGAAAIGALIGVGIISLYYGFLIWAGMELINLAFPSLGPLGFWQSTAFGAGLALISTPIMAALKLNSQLDR